MTERTRIFYLILLIFFLLVIGFFLFDYYQFIEADQIFPFLAKKPAPVRWDKEAPTEMEKLEFSKREEKLLEEKEEVEKLRASLKEEQDKLKSEIEKIEQLKENLRRKEKDLNDKQMESSTREEQIRVLASKVSGMPPEKAVEMLVNWPDTDIIDVFKQMDKIAEEEGRSTITTYLLTLFKPERRAVIANKWLDSDSSKNPPIIIPDTDYTAEENKQKQ